MICLITVNISIYPNKNDKQHCMNILVYFDAQMVTIT